MFLSTPMGEREESVNNASLTVQEGCPSRGQRNVDLGTQVPKALGWAATGRAPGPRPWEDLCGGQTGTVPSYLQGKASKRWGWGWKGWWGRVCGEEEEWKGMLG